jgi:hypothetical protein
MKKFIYFFIKHIDFISKGMIVNVKIIDFISKGMIVNLKSDQKVSFTFDKDIIQLFLFKINVFSDPNLSPPVL